MVGHRGGEELAEHQETLVAQDPLPQGKVDGTPALFDRDALPGTLRVVE